MIISRAAFCSGSVLVLIKCIFETSIHKEVLIGSLRLLTLYAVCSPINIVSSALHLPITRDVELQ